MLVPLGGGHDVKSARSLSRNERSADAPQHDVHRRPRGVQRSDFALPVAPSTYALLSRSEVFEFRGRFNGELRSSMIWRLMAEFFMDRSHLPDIYRTWHAYFVQQTSAGMSSPT